MPNDRHTVLGAFLLVAACGGQTVASTTQDAATIDALPDIRAADTNSSSNAADGSVMSQWQLDAAKPNAPEGCLALCLDKASDCGAPTKDAQPICQALCAESPTALQLECIQESRCDSLANAFAQNGSICGIGVQQDAGSAVPGDAPGG